MRSRFSIYLNVIIAHHSALDWAFWGGSLGYWPLLLLSFIKVINIVIVLPGLLLRRNYFLRLSFEEILLLRCLVFFPIIICLWLNFRIFTELLKVLFEQLLKRLWSPSANGNIINVHSLLWNTLLILANSLRFPEVHRGVNLIYLVFIIAIGWTLWWILIVLLLSKALSLLI